MRKVYVYFAMFLFLFACGGGGTSNDTASDENTPDVNTTPDQVVTDNTTPTPDVVAEDNTNTADTGPTDPFAGIDLTPDPDCTGHWLVGTTGFVVDEDQTPVPGTRVQLCIRDAKDDSLQCLTPATAQDDGSYVITAPLLTRCISEGVMRLVLPKSQRVVQYCPLQLEGEGAIIESSEPFVMFATTPATTLPERGDEEVERTVIFEDGMELDMVPSSFFGSGDGYDGISVRKLAMDTPGLCTTGTSAVEFDIVYGFAPEGDVWKDSYALRQPASPDQAGMLAEFYVLGGLNCTLVDETHVGETEWAKFAEGIVAEDGMVHLSKEAGLPCIGWMGVVFSQPTGTP